MQATAGDILKVYCATKLVWHYGVCTERGTVIDMAPRWGVMERSWDEFAEGEPVYIEPRENDDLPKEAILQRAKVNIGQLDYHVIFRNCEHFVTWCRKGKFSSKQVVKFILAVVGITVVTILVIRVFRRR